ncbi:MAG: hypothetical protein J1E60_04765 [Christensenellaceae bacterium]|nr:hypothetical protein [Christensenellaceae bacterium]
MDSEFRFELSNAYPTVILHDCIVDRIEIKDNVTFTFPDGFWIQELEGFSKNAAIEISMDDIYDFSCALVHHNAWGRRPNFYGHKIALAKVSKMLSKGIKIELIDEFYTINHLFWRFCVIPKRQWRRFSDELIIECNITEGNLCMQYKWN